MMAGAQEAGSCPRASGAEQEEFVFTSSHRSLRARGILARIDAPAAGGVHDHSLFLHAVDTALQQARAGGQRNPLVIGAIPFDTREPSCLYVPQEYEEVQRNDLVAACRCVHPRVQPQSVRSIPDESGFKAAVQQAIANFQHSEIRKAVLGRLCEIHLCEPVDLECVFANLVARNPSAFHFRLPLPDGAQLIGASPELVVRRQGRQVFSHPLAGSARRGPDSRQDGCAASQLLRSRKDQYEHQLVIEEIRQVLAPLCRSLSVPETPSLLGTSTMWHLGTPVQGELEDPAPSVLQLACQLHPTAAVCGVPRVLARKLVDLIEPFERGLFSGIVGWCDGHGDGEWAMTIRCASVSHEMVRLFAGAGIVAASQAQHEWEETQAKMATMLDAFGLEREAMTA